VVYSIEGEIGQEKVREGGAVHGAVLAQMTAHSPEANPLHFDLLEPISEPIDPLEPRRQEGAT
jgi:hypothetical protein